jgi:D-lactate dehydrogenase
MKIALFSTKPYDRTFFERANREHGFELRFLEPRLTEDTAVLAEGEDAVCPFVNDDVGEGVLRALHAGGTRHIALRSAGFNHVDLETARELGMVVTHVPAYSPHAVADHTLALILALNRKTHRAYNRVREGNFSLNGLLGFDLNGRTAGIVGTGKIGALVAQRLQAFGCNVIAHDPYPNEECARKGVRYTAIEELFGASDIVSLHCPLTLETRHIVDGAALEAMRPGVMLINTGRGALVDTPAVIEALKSGRLGYLGLDVYEEEADLFFEDRSAGIITDDVFARLLTFPNVLITGHQGFFTETAMLNIAGTTLANVSAWERGENGMFRVPEPRQG